MGDDGRDQSLVKGSTAMLVRLGGTGEINPEKLSRFV